MLTMGKFLWVHMAVGFGVGVYLVNRKDYDEAVETVVRKRAAYSTEHLLKNKGFMIAGSTLLGFISLFAAMYGLVKKE